MPSIFSLVRSHSLCRKTQRIRLSIQPRPKLSLVKSQICWVESRGHTSLDGENSTFLSLKHCFLLDHARYWETLRWFRLGSARCEAREPSQRRMAPEAWRKEESSVDKSFFFCTVPSWTITNHHEPSSTITNHHEPSWTIMNYHEPSSTIISNH